MSFFTKRHIYSPSVISAVDHVAKVIRCKMHGQPANFVSENENRLLIVSGCFMGCIAADPGSAKSPDLIDSKLVSMGFDKLFSTRTESDYALSQIDIMMRAAIPKTRTAVNLGVLMSLQHFGYRFDYFNIYDVIDKYFVDPDLGWHYLLDDDKKNLSDENIEDSVYIEASNALLDTIEQIQAIFVPILIGKNKRRFIERLLLDIRALGDFWGYFSEAYKVADISNENGYVYTDVFMREVFTNKVLGRVVWQKCGELREAKDPEFLQAASRGRSRFRESELRGFMDTVIDGSEFTSPFEC